MRPSSTPPERCIDGGSDVVIGPDGFVGSDVSTGLVVTAVGDHAVPVIGGVENHVIIDERGENGQPDPSKFGRSVVLVESKQSVGRKGCRTGISRGFGNCRILEILEGDQIIR